MDVRDWVPFECYYALSAIVPYYPRSMIGILLYGVMKEHSSLRALKNLARLDLGVFLSIMELRLITLVLGVL